MQKKLIKLTVGISLMFFMTLALAIPGGKEKKLFAYIADFSNQGIVACPVNNDGSFGACTLIKDNTFNRPNNVVLNETGTVAYITDSMSSSIYICPIKSDGTFEQCSVKNDLERKDDMSLALKFNNSYVVSDAKIQNCSMNKDGTFGKCFVTNLDYIRTFPFNARMSFVKLNKSDRFAYISAISTPNSRGNDRFNGPDIPFVMTCPINQTTHLLEKNCQETQNFPEHKGKEISAINFNPTGTALYVAFRTGGSDKLLRCSIEEANEIISSCAPIPSDPNIGIITGMAINPKGTFAYIVGDRDGKTSNIVICPIKPDGSFGPCKLSDAGGLLRNPRGLTLGLIGS